VSHPRGMRDSIYNLGSTAVCQESHIIKLIYQERELIYRVGSDHNLTLCRLILNLVRVIASAAPC